jgi:hypothetical protein
VIERGDVDAGSKVEILDRDPDRITVSDIVRLYLGQTRDPELLRRATNVGSLPENGKLNYCREHKTGPSNPWSQGI